ncbi:WecB/TagA/CpsF family glycosyltransferase [Latilactobacillus fuchuensis]|uniref:N-acetylglucosaminyldiphosphoundecaprenol N-acetyl-beta-D-mannosaminyltransferase n=2 Tax=Latilactobacillus fuchuensis TaxID=164393 RepID=A0A2N9DX90_9LACO|nr:WecB/TagA/CpsF family glycosyltransferase [Latilactobacillus fuchuensis]KRL59039.1 UDP-N-acetyl-D-mannosamine transferase [Latilactobacillus fuchuensis DSM 14340 = JCM 11249]SPC39309.1 N-acetylmannosamine (ManNAc) C4 hydroxyl of a membrane-anchored N-acetylglucosaminyl diphospholipid (GlcNAc-pp-undecaprenyl, lipid I) glycosyltransferase [Latilactobacillus fuchuensis]
MKVDILNVPFDNYTESEFIAKFQERIEQQQKTLVVTANPEIVMYAKETPKYQKLLLNEADYITADGIGVIKAGQMLKTPIKERVTGYDLFLALLNLANQKKLSVYLVGAKQEIIELAVQRIAEDYPDIQLVGYHNGYFDIEDLTIQTDIIDKAPDMVFAALGFPKQEYFLTGLKHQLDKGYLMGIGGSFDVFSGVTKRAPVWMQRLHLEWFYRLLKEPTRFKRMLVLPKFIQEVKKVGKG